MSQEVPQNFNDIFHAESKELLDLYPQHEYELLEIIIDIAKKINGIIEGDPELYTKKTRELMRNIRENMKIFRVRELRGHPMSFLLNIRKGLRNNKIKWEEIDILPLNDRMDRAEKIQKIKEYVNEHNISLLKKNDAGADLIECIEIFQLALEINLQDSGIYFSLGAIFHYGLEFYQKAIDAYEKALDCNPQDIEINLWLARCYEKMGDEEKANYFNKIYEDYINNKIYQKNIN